MLIAITVIVSVSLIMQAKWFLSLKKDLENIECLCEEILYKKVKEEK